MDSEERRCPRIVIDLNNSELQEINAALKLIIHRHKSSWLRPLILNEARRIIKKNKEVSG